MSNFPNLSKAKTLVIDVETNGVDWKTNYIVGLVVAAGPGPNESWYWPTRHETGKNHSHDVVMRWLREEIASRTDVRIVGHNLKFDLHMLANENVHIATRALECTMVNEALIDENVGKYSLDACAPRYKIQAKRAIELYTHLADVFGGEPKKGQMENYWRLPAHDKVANEYARGDGTTTYQLWEKQQVELDAQDLRVVHDVECRVLRTLFRMERRGVLVDEEELNQLRVRTLADIDACRLALPNSFNPRSPKQVRLLMEKHGHTSWPTTLKGNPSFPEEWLSTNTQGARIVELRQMDNLLSSFIQPMQDRHLHNGRVHTNFNQTKQDDYGVVTGRLSSSAPNMQQVPKRNKILAPRFRKIFLPEKHHWWSSNDYRQQEFVIFTEYTRNPMLVKGYKSTPQIDIHTNVATMMNVERDPTAKRLNLGTVYGMGVVKLALKLKCSLAEAKLLYQQYHRMIPEAKRFARKAESRAKARGYVKTKLGRRRRYPDPRYAYQAMNSIIQGTSADATKVKMVEVDEYFEEETNDECGLLLQVHDDLCFTIPEGMRDHDEEAQRIMQDFSAGQLIELDIPLLIDHTEGLTWAEATFGGDE